MITLTYHGAFFELSVRGIVWYEISHPEALELRRRLAVLLRSEVIGSPEDSESAVLTITVRQDDKDYVLVSIKHFSVALTNAEAGRLLELLEEEAN